MAWYNGGTVTVTNGSTVVTGAGTDFVNNVSARDAFALIGGNPNEIASVQSATQMTLVRPWLGASGGGQAYYVIPTVGIYVDLALRALNMLTPYRAVLDGIGQGVINPGSPISPGLRFANDQDTGIVYYGVSTLGFASGGSVTAAVNPYGLLAFGYGGAPVNPKSCANIGPYGSVSYDVVAVGTVFGHNFYYGGGNQYYGRVGGRALGLRFGDDGITAFMNVQSGDTPFTPTTVFKIDTAGNMLAGVAVGNEHTFAKEVAQGGLVFRAQTSGNGGAPSITVAGVTAYTPNGSGAAVYLGHSSVTNRSINAGGTINASGADYAEYMTKADGCGTIAAGDVCGVDVDGKLTRYWAAAVSFVVKSTDPSLVGGDIWAAHMDPKPDAPGPEPIAPGDGPVMPDSDEAEGLATWHAEAVAHTALIIAYPGEHAAWASDQAKYEAALNAWETELETARQCVDRIAFCGQVPVNVTGEFAVGDYIVAVANGSGIKAVAVSEADITFDQYRRRIGKIWAVRDGRAWIDVQHG